jgi:hypothetical protein
MTERQLREVERVLLSIGDAGGRAKRAIASLAADGAEQHVLDALGCARESLSRSYRDLSQGTYYAIRPAGDATSATNPEQNAG